MRKIYNTSIQRQISYLFLSLLAIVALLILVDISLHDQRNRTKKLFDNQVARQNIGISIYRRIFITRAIVSKISTLDDLWELQLERDHFNKTLMHMEKGLLILQKGGVFEDQIETNIPGKDTMLMIAQYKKPPLEGYVIEVLELGPALHNLNEQVQLLCELIKSNNQEDRLVGEKQDIRSQSLLMMINTNLQRLQENASRVLHDSYQKKTELSMQLKEAQQIHDKVRVLVILLGLSLAGYLLYNTLNRVGTVIEKRKHAEERLHLLLDTTVEGIYGIDTRGYTTFVNPAAAKMLGYKSEELVGFENHTLIHHSRSDGTKYPSEECRMLGVLAGGVLRTVDDEVFWRKDGFSFPVEYSSTPITSHGEIIGAVVNFHDISERRHSEKWIRTLSQAVEQSPVSVIMTDLDGNIEYVNCAFEKSTGFSREEVIGKNPRIMKSNETPP